MYVQTCNTVHLKITVINVGIKIHNSLPPELKGIGNVKVFKNKLNRYLLQNCFYSLQEFILVAMLDGSLVLMQCGCIYI